MSKDPQGSGFVVGNSRSKTVRKKMKAPEYEDDRNQDGSPGQRSEIQDPVSEPTQIWQAAYRINTD
ncbi:hypothetical protein PHMEG_00019147 [Phytophthora megakarya]|uniref:Uncharacterized protein n=1 Tax=Phytophthora megakarya TaxID=4795 RepID=A0A225VS13_9STRA|nr:hypothetical protein PHMEG_00019147 [Phytophthora megakarya]